MEFALTPRLRCAIELVILRGGDAAVLAPCARDDARGISLEHVRLLSRLLREEEPRLQHVWVLPAPRARTRPDRARTTRLGALSGARVARGCHAAAACQTGEARAAPRAGTPDGAAPRSAGDQPSPSPPPHLHSHPFPDQQLRAAQTRDYGLQPHVSRLLPCIPRLLPCIPRLQPHVSRPAASTPR